MLITFAEWRKKIDEIGGVATIVTKKDCNNPDYQVQGAVCSGKKNMKSDNNKGRRKT